MSAKKLGDIGLGKLMNIGWIYGSLERLNLMKMDRRWNYNPTSPSSSICPTL
jgi:hypothetical protein